MSKVYIDKIEHCTSCPAVSADINVTRFQCRKMKNRFICWMGSGEDTEPIPSWCPLDDVLPGKVYMLTTEIK